MESSRELLIHDEMSEKIVRAAENMVTESGAHAITVRKLLLELGITNRVFYNRFHNIDEVLEIVYKNTILKIRESLKSAFDEQKDFFENVSFHDFSSFFFDELSFSASLSSLERSKVSSYSSSSFANEDLIDSSV